MRGASTISQQVAKNLFLWPGQSWFRKGLEAGITVLIELAWPKQRILEVYLNVAEFGRGTWGVQAASRRYFNKDAARLNRAEAALLAAVLPRRSATAPTQPGPYVRKRQAWIERQMAALGGPGLSGKLGLINRATTTGAFMTITTRIAIIGAGHSGICMGMRLKRAGIDDFLILEKAASLGGTWRDNTYPGASCDAPSFLYSFSFAQKTDWSRRFAWQSELLGYAVECAVQSGLLAHCRFNSEVTAARFDDARSLWRIELADGEIVEAQFLVTGVGQLHRPATPSIPGRDDFRGVQFHSARWDHGVDLAGKRIAVIGNAASAVQFVPQIAPLAPQLTIFQRSANWLMPRKDRLYSPRAAAAHDALAVAREGCVTSSSGSYSASCSSRR